MSGGNWNQFPHNGNNDIPADENGPAAVDDDDFGDFEGFEVAHEIGAREAQPLPRALQATWNNFPDYVPSQCASSGSLQPDLLPTTQSTAATTISCTSHSSSSSPAIPGFSSSILQPPDVSSGHHVNVRQQTTHQPPHLDLADLHLLQDGNCKSAISDDGAIGPQPDLADVEVPRGRNAFQAHYPDVSPQRASSSSSSASISSVSDHHGNNGPRPPLLQDLSDLVLRQPSGNDLGGREGGFAGGFSASLVATAPESSPSGSESTYSSPPESKVDGEYLFPGRAAMMGYGLEGTRSRGNHQIPPIVEQQLNLLRDQNHHLFREIGELKNQNSELIRLMSQCLNNVNQCGRQDGISPNCCGDCMSVSSELKMMAADVERHETQMINEVRQLLTEHRDLCRSQIEEQFHSISAQFLAKGGKEELSASLLAKMLDTHAVNQEAIIDSKLTAMREELRREMDKWTQTLSPDGANDEHRFKNVLSDLEQAIQSLKSYTDEQEKRNANSLGLTVSMLDSLLVGARQQLRENFFPQPDNSRSNS